jgi:enhancing lycopene biosynthesis protein 2
VSQKKIGVVLSGCGYLDGAEIHESVLTLLALDRAGVDIVCMAPDRDQADVVDHRTNAPTNETRNVLTESARIARGDVQNVRDVDLDQLDAIVLPGGFGAAKNLCTFASDGPDCGVDEDVAHALRTLHAAGKPIAALCIAPAVVAALFGSQLHPSITIGTDAGTAAALEKMGARHRNAKVTEAVVDAENRLVTTPCYMSATRVSEVAEGAENAVRELLKLVERSAPATA